MGTAVYELFTMVLSVIAFDISKNFSVWGAHQYGQLFINALLDIS